MSAHLPDAGTLAQLVSNVTQTMCGISFEPAAAAVACEVPCWRIATLAIDGARPLLVALSSNREGCVALGSALFACEPETLDGGMIDDSLCELLNMAAGQIKSALALDQMLGLPRILEDGEQRRTVEQVMREGVVLRSRGALALLIWVADRAAVGNSTQEEAPTGREEEKTRG